MGGGDIKLLAVFGFVLGVPMSIISVFLSAFIALPISLIILKIKKNHEIPFGPFLAISAAIIFFLQIDFNKIIDFLTIF
jgi:leader peptidase (prepilin peptidase)/N-methyltransferase